MYNWTNARVARCCCEGLSHVAISTTTHTVKHTNADTDTEMSNGAPRGVKQKNRQKKNHLVKYTKIFIHIFERPKSLGLLCATRERRARPTNTQKRAHTYELCSHGALSHSSSTSRTQLEPFHRNIFFVSRLGRTSTDRTVREFGARAAGAMCESVSLCARTISHYTML